MRWKISHVHMIGIGGIGMSGIAEVLLNLGYRVSGSDLKESDFTRRLGEMGARIRYQHKAGNVKGSDVVVVSSAVRETNPEVAEARRLGLPIIPRAEMLAELMRMKNGIAIAGSHGKTTTTSMVSTVLHAAGWDPTVVIGGRLDSFGSNARLGTGEWMVVEADESDGTFLKLRPMLAVVTNIDREHMDHYKDTKQLERAFLDFINSVPFYGLSTVCMDCAAIRKLLPGVKRRHLTYGENRDAELRAVDIVSRSGGCVFRVMEGERELGEVSLGMPGKHNAINALSAVAVGLELGIGFASIAGALKGFGGIQRRFQVKGLAGGVIVIDDYGHHPTEIRATLEAARGWTDPRLPGGRPKRVICAFQPHRYSRTKDLKKEFTGAFDEADILILTDIYPAGEDPIAGVTGEGLFESVKRSKRKRKVEIEYIPDRNDIPARLKSIVGGGDLVITMGAGNIWQAGEELIRLLGGDRVDL